MLIRRALPPVTTVKYRSLDDPLTDIQIAYCASQLRPLVHIYRTADGGFQRYEKLGDASEALLHTTRSTGLANLAYLNAVAAK